MGTQDKAAFSDFYTLKIFDFIVECVDANLVQSLWERLGRSANSLTIINLEEPTYIDSSFYFKKKERIETIQPTFLISVPFQGIYILLFVPQWVKSIIQYQNFNGGGFPNTNCVRFQIAFLSFSVISRWMMAKPIEELI
jgi:hypothetical protein